jgi:predicted nucleic-acid-binding Zn-ribbon protein
MKDGTCPKCGSTEVHVVAGNRFRPDIQIGSFAKAFLRPHVCTRCGYVEMYVEDAADLPKIAARWPRVDP